MFKYEYLCIQYWLNNNIFVTQCYLEIMQKSLERSLLVFACYLDPALLSLTDTWWDLFILQQWKEQNWLDLCLNQISSQFQMWFLTGINMWNTLTRKSSGSYPTDTDWPTKLERREEKFCPFNDCIVKRFKNDMNMKYTFCSVNVELFWHCPVVFWINICSFIARNKGKKCQLFWGMCFLTSDSNRKKTKRIETFIINLIILLAKFHI